VKGARSDTFTDDELDEIARRYRAGDSLRTLSEAYACSTAPIRNALKIRRVALRRGTSSLSDFRPRVLRGTGS